MRANARLRRQASVKLGPQRRHWRRQRRRRGGRRGVRERHFRVGRADADGAAGSKADEEVARPEQVARPKRGGAQPRRVAVAPDAPTAWETTGHAAAERCARHQTTRHRHWAPPEAPAHDVAGQCAWHFRLWLPTSIQGRSRFLLQVNPRTHLAFRTIFSAAIFVAA
jgi:hypothetical protein